MVAIGTMAMEEGAVVKGFWVRMERQRQRSGCCKEAVVGGLTGALRAGCRLRRGEIYVMVAHAGGDVRVWMRKAKEEEKEEERVLGFS